MNIAEQPIGTKLRIQFGVIECGNIPPFSLKFHQCKIKIVPLPFLFFHFI